MPDTCTSIINLSYPPGSVGCSSNPERFDKVQDYDELKKYYVRNRMLFTDRTFPPDNVSLGDVEALSPSQEAQVRWCRPREIMEILNIKGDPVFRSCCESRFDFGQGFIGNCWFLAAISSLTLNKRLTVQVVPEQSFDDYAGIFHFRFWRFGKWVDVVIDDYLPIFRNDFLSVNAKQTNEFWVPLMEKAYAKVCGSYADMNAGYTSESCKDMSGGLSLDFPLQQVHDDDHDAELWSSLSFGSRCKSLMCCGTPSADGGRVVNSKKNNGLINAHAYSVTKVTEVYHRGSKVKLVRVLNPWGKQEWNGNWSDDSPLWNEVSSKDRLKCEKDENGEFWMELEDFCHNFNCLTICCENPNFMDGDLGCQWQLMINEGKWTSAGGSLSDYSFHTNPQFRTMIDIRNEEEDFDMNCFVSLMQKPSERNRKKARYFPVGIYIFQIPRGTSPGRLDRTFFRRNRPVAQIKFASMRETTNWYSLPPGEYLIVPSTLRQYMRTEFVLSIWTKSNMTINSFGGEDEDEHEHDNGNDHGHDHGNDHGHDHGNDHDNDHGNDRDDADNGGDNLILPEIPVKKEESDPKELFDQYADWRGELNAKQLQKLLNSHIARGAWDGISRDTCMDFIIMFNTDNYPRMMNFEEFSELWIKINKYKQIFEDADANHNGVLNQAELNTAIEAAGASSGVWADVAMFRFSFGESSLNMLSFLDLMIHLDHKISVLNSHFSDGFVRFSTDDWFNDMSFF